MSYRNILIVKLSAIGDVIHALPVAYVLKEQYPEAKITWVVEQAAYDLLTNNPYIDEIILFEKARLKTVFGALSYAINLSRELKQRRFDLALDLQGLFKSAAISWLSGAKEKLVYCNAREMSDKIGTRICGEHFEGHVVERYLDVAAYVGCKIDKREFSVVITPAEEQSAKQVAIHAGLNIEKKYAVLAPGTNWVNKCWPMPHFAELVDKLYQVGIIPVIIGGPNDRRLYEEIAANAEIPPVDLTGRTKLKQLAYIIKNAQVFVGGDTGPMHLAAAVQTPVVTVFGPTTPKRNGPYTKPQLSKVLKIQKDCAGCWQRNCPKKLDCLAEITPAKVYEALEEYINRENIG